MAILDGLAVRGASSAMAGADIVKTANAKAILILPLLPPRMAEQRPRCRRSAAVSIQSM
jgi:hypothetical protein